MEDRFDALIVGGGPAGLSAAIVLAGAGLRPLVCERRRFPIDKACGEGVMPTGVAHLERLGVLKHLAKESSAPFLGIRYHSPRGSVAAAAFSEGPGLGIRRRALSDALLSRAREFPSLVIREGEPVEPLARGSDGVVVRVGGKVLSTRLLVGADGLSSRVRRFAGLDGARKRLRRYGARHHFAIERWSEHVEVHWREGIEAYVTPSGVREVGVALLWDRARHGKVPGRETAFASMLRWFPDLERRLAGVPPSDRLLASGPLYRTATGSVADGVLLVGDAAGYLDAITGEGLSLAMAQSHALEDTVVPLLAGSRSRGMLRAAELAGYAHALRAIVGPYYRVTRLVLFLSRHPGLAERVIRIFSREPDLFRLVLSASMGLRSPWPTTRGEAARWLRGVFDSRFKAGR